MKKAAYILILGAMLLVGACSDSDNDEPKPDESSPYPSKEVFESEIKNNLWVLEEERNETEDGVEFPAVLWELFAGGPGTPYMWYFWGENAILCQNAMPSFGYFWDDVDYDPSTGLLTYFWNEEVNTICQIIAVDGDYLTVKRKVMFFKDPGDDDFMGIWQNIENKDQLINKMIYQIGTFKKKVDADLKEELSHYLFYEKDPDDFGIY